METRLITTADGSSSLFVPELNEHYHSAFGAIQESGHVFIQSGLKYIQAEFKRINLLEIGFGTGLNALLSCLYAGDSVIEYTAIEAHPLEIETINRLNYPEILTIELASGLFQKIHLSRWEKKSVITENFILKKMKTFIEEAVFESQKYHLIYFDAFSPDVQPELWTLEVFGKLFHSLVIGGILVTYSSKGLVKKNLRDAGFEVERLAGPPGKRHILRAKKV